eukprot:13384717-Alexandrium_andersonii.AAC.1
MWWAPQPGADCPIIAIPIHCLVRQRPGPSQGRHVSQGLGHSLQMEPRAGGLASDGIKKWRRCLHIGMHTHRYTYTHTPMVMAMAMARVLAKAMATMQTEPWREPNISPVEGQHESLEGALEGEPSRGPRRESPRKGLAGTWRRRW